MSLLPMNLVVDSFFDRVIASRDQALFEKSRADKCGVFGLALLIIGISLVLIALVLALAVPGLVSLPGVIGIGLAGLGAIVIGMILIITMLKIGSRAASRFMDFSGFDVNLRNEFQRLLDTLRLMEEDLSSCVHPNSRIEAIFNNRIKLLYRLMRGLFPTDVDVTDVVGVDRRVEISRNLVLMQNQMDILRSLIPSVKKLHEFLTALESLVAELDLSQEMESEILQSDRVKLLNNEIVSVANESFSCFSPERIEAVNQRLDEAVNLMMECKDRYQSMCMDPVFGSSLIRVLEVRYRTMLPNVADAQRRIKQSLWPFELVRLEDTIGQASRKTKEEIEKATKEATTKATELKQQAANIGNQELIGWVAGVVKLCEDQRTSFEVRGDVSGEEKTGKVLGARLMEHNRAVLILRKARMDLDRMHDCQECQGAIENAQRLVSAAINENEQGREIFQANAARITAIVCRNHLSIQEDVRRVNLVSNLWRDCISAYINSAPDERGGIPHQETNDIDCILKNIDQMHACFRVRSEILDDLQNSLMALSEAATGYQSMDLENEDGELDPREGLALFQRDVDGALAARNHLFRESKLSFNKCQTAQKASDEERGRQEAATCNSRRALEIYRQWFPLVQARALAEVALLEARRDQDSKFDPMNAPLTTALATATLRLEEFKQRHSDIVGVIRLMEGIFSCADARQVTIDIVQVLDGLQLFWQMQTALLEEKRPLDFRCDILSVLSQTLCPPREVFILDSNRLQEDFKAIQTSSVLIRKRVQEVINLLKDLGCRNSLIFLMEMLERTGNLSHVSVEMRWLEKVINDLNENEDH